MSLCHSTQKNRQQVPQAIRSSLLMMLSVAALVSVPFLGEWGPLPTTALLDGWIVLFIVACIVRGRISTTLTVGLLILYLISRLVAAIYSEPPLEDFLQAHRWILYLIAFGLAVGRVWGTPRALVRLMWTLLSLALIKASMTFIVHGPGERPGLFLENNFEIALFVGLIVVVYRFLGRGRIYAVLLMGGLTLLGGSRSGAVAFLFLALFAIFQGRQANIFVKYMKVLLIPALIAIPVWIFQQRANGASRIDRINFLGVFIDETANWSVFNWIFGTVPITPLSPAGCYHLSYYQGLFSSAGDGSCYSVIFHAFLLRVIFDSGIFGLFIAFGVTWRMMRRANVQFGVAFTLIAVAISNSLSVSGLNNPYVALPILLAIVTASMYAPSEFRLPRRAEIKENRKSPLTVSPLDWKRTQASIRETPAPRAPRAEAPWRDSV